MKNPSIFTFRDNLASYIDSVVKTKIPVVIYKYKKPIAMVVPYDKKKKLKEIEELYGFMGTSGKDGVSYENRVRRSKKEREYVKKLRKGIA